jgi:hypothetical protein
MSLSPSLSLPHTLPLSTGQVTGLLAARRERKQAEAQGAERQYSSKKRFLLAPGSSPQVPAQPLLFPGAAGAGADAGQPLSAAGAAAAGEEAGVPQGGATGDWAAGQQGRDPPEVLESLKAQLAQLAERQVAAAEARLADRIGVCLQQVGDQVAAGMAAAAVAAVQSHEVDCAVAAIPRPIIAPVARVLV